MEADLLKAPISFTSRYLLLWAYKREKGKLLERA
jgi:hypothetical protein